MTVGVLVFVIAGGALFFWSHAPPARARERAVRPIPLSGDASQSEAELSALAWWGDRLVLVPQYPERFDDAFFTIAEADLEAFLERGVAPPIGRLPIDLPDLATLGYDGFEAIVFSDDEVFAAIEIERAEDGSVGLLVRGEVVDERIVFQAEPMARMAAQNELANTGYEALVLHDDRLLAFYETNGEINEAPQVLVFDRALRPVGELSLDHLEYRVTDASEMDARGRFWVANYHWPGAPWGAGSCALTEAHGQGLSHARCATVERLVEMVATDGAVRPTGRAPIQLELVDDAHARNWEGLVRWGERGFLVVTDEHPESILGFVEGR